MLSQDYPWFGGGELFGQGLQPKRLHLPPTCGPDHAWKNQRPPQRSRSPGPPAQSFYSISAIPLLGCSAASHAARIGPSLSPSGFLGSWGRQKPPTQWPGHRIHIFTSYGDFFSSNAQYSANSDFPHNPSIRGGLSVVEQPRHLETAALSFCDQLLLVCGFFFGCLFSFFLLQFPLIRAGGSIKRNENTSPLLLF